MTRNLGPGPAHRSETTSSARPVGASSGRHFGVSHYARPLAGLSTVAVLALIFALAVGLFRGSFTESIPVTVISDRAGLVMNPDAKVKMRGVQVGRVAAIDYRPDGTAELQLAMDPGQLRLIPDNVLVDVASSTVFGAKFVQLEAPPEPSATTLQAGQVLRGDHVTVEINTVFQQLVSVLDKIDPTQLNETLNAISAAFNGRGEQFGQTLSDFNAFLAEIEPSLPNLSRDIEMAPTMLAAYADSAPDVITVADSATRISDGIVDEQHNLDAFLVSATGLADLGNEVIGGNRAALTEVARLLVPTTDVLNKYNQHLWCGIGGIIPFAKSPPFPFPGTAFMASFTLGTERYRYPTDLPKVNAKGRTYCEELGLPEVPPEFRSPHIIADVGANPWKYGNEGILLNSDGLKQFLFGPIDGPPRNTAQIGQPG